MVVADILKGSMAEHFADRSVLMDQFVQSVVIMIEIKPYDATHQDRPQAHAGAPIVLVHPWGDLTL